MLKYLGLILALLTTLSGPLEAAMGQRTLAYYDEARMRPIIMDVWYETAKEKPLRYAADWVETPVVLHAPLKTLEKKSPLIIMSHGSGGERRDLIWIAEELVKQDYIVVSLDHYGNSWKGRFPAAYVKYWERPQDVTVALDYLLKTSPIRDAVDGTRIGFAGFSVGGMTGLWLAGARVAKAVPPSLKENEAAFPEGVDPSFLDEIDLSEATKSYHDQRIGAYFIMAPAVGDLSPSSIREIQAPVFVIYGAGDEVLPVAEHAEKILGLLPKAEHHRFDSPAGHFIFLRRPTELGRAVIPHHLIRDAEGVDRSAIHQKTRSLARDLFKKYL